ncbi:MAG: preprotein translocase subunit SecA, partial [Clostridia bacterium]|nr:preprotein translocase subunit SecA [Clostridia bacterium]
VATLPAYLNALTGKGVHIVTVNEYLAHRDSEEMGQVYRFLGLSCGCISHAMNPRDRQAAYAADITYGTNSEFGFDYLRDNMVLDLRDAVQRGLHFAIIDEVDSVLIDEARTPLIISGMGENASDLYRKADAFVRGLTGRVVTEIEEGKNADALSEQALPAEEAAAEGAAGEEGTATPHGGKDADKPTVQKYDFVVDEKARTAVLTGFGITKAEEHFKLENLSDPENADLANHISLALRAHAVMQRDVNYVVTQDRQVIIVDSATGRLMPGRRFNGGLHQAIEVKEGVPVKQENKTVATITYQNLFRLYQKLSGMTGTAMTEEAEFKEIYRLDVVEVPTNMPMIRVDHNDLLYGTVEGKYKAILAKIKECHDKGQPVLVGTSSVEKSEELSKRLTQMKIKHSVLNAKQHEREAEIVAQAGTPGAVTISTNMAGRGTDILLGGNPEFMARRELARQGYSPAVIEAACGTYPTQHEQVLEARPLYRELLEKYRLELAPAREQVVAAGGLFILGTERHESRRIDDQLRGRSGRQGDPGESQFMLSLEDDLLRIFGEGRIMSMVKSSIEDDAPLNFGILTRQVRAAQMKMESRHFSYRRHVLEFDNVIAEQRNLIYKQRREVLENEDIRPLPERMIREYVAHAVEHYLSEDNLGGLVRAFTPWCQTRAALDYRYTVQGLSDLDGEQIKERFLARALEIYGAKCEQFGDEMRQIERKLLLRAVDRLWMDHIDAMDDLKDSVQLSNYAQRQPISEYRILGSQMFNEMTESIRDKAALSFLTVRVVPKTASTPATTAGFRQGARRPTSAGKPVPQRPAPVKHGPKVGPNDPCPCGSGQKYKLCCKLKES